MTHAIPGFDDLWSLCHVVSIPLRTPFRGIHYRETLIIEGPEGPGEWAAFIDYDDEESAWWLAAALEQAFSPVPKQLSGIPGTIPVNAIVPALPAKDVEEWLTRFDGVSTAKVKVAEPGQEMSHDIERVAEVQRVLGPKAKIRIDANGAWGVDEALQVAQALEGFNVDYFEQPVATIDQMRELKAPLADLGIRLAADELLRKTHQIDSLLGGDVCDVVIVKPSPLGGTTRSVEFAKRAISSGVEVVVSSGLETSVGLSPVARVAGFVNREAQRHIAHGLATTLLFSGDVVRSPIVPTGGEISTAPVKLDHQQLKLFAPSTERRDWWHKRLQRCLPLARELAGYSPEYE